MTWAGAFYVKRQKRLFKLSNAYDILDSKTHEQIALVCEENGFIVKLLRICISRFHLPNNIVFHDYDKGSCLFKLRQPYSLKKASTKVFDNENKYLGCFKRKLFTVADFDIIDSNGEQIAKVVGDWNLRSFKIVNKDGIVLCVIAKKWEGFLKLLLFGFNTYEVNIDKDSCDNEYVELMVLAGCVATIAIFGNAK